MRTLTGADVIRLMREEWDARVQALVEKAGDVKVAASDADELLTPGLKIIHKSSGLKYTVDSVGPENIILRTPEGKTFVIDNHKLEKEYALS